MTLTQSDVTELLDAVAPASTPQRGATDTRAGLRVRGTTQWRKAECLVPHRWTLSARSMDTTSPFDS